MAHHPTEIVVVLMLCILVVDSMNVPFKSKFKLPDLDELDEICQRIENYLNKDIAAAKSQVDLNKLIAAAKGGEQSFKLPHELKAESDSLKATVSVIKRLKKINSELECKDVNLDLLEGIGKRTGGLEEPGLETDEPIEMPRLYAIWKPIAHNYANRCFGEHVEPFNSQGAVSETRKKLEKFFESLYDNLHKGQELQGKDFVTKVQAISWPMEDLDEDFGRALLDYLTDNAQDKRDMDTIRGIRQETRKRTFGKSAAPEAPLLDLYERHFESHCKIYLEKFAPFVAAAERELRILDQTFDLANGQTGQISAADRSALFRANILHQQCKRALRPGNHEGAIISLVHAVSSAN